MMLSFNQRISGWNVLCFVIVLLPALSSFPQKAFGQRTETKQRVAVGAGTFGNTIKDDLASPLTFTGMVPSYHVNYQHEAKHTLHRVSLDFGIGTNLKRVSIDESSLEFEPLMDFNHVGFSYQFLPRLWNPNGTLDLYAGPALKNTINVREYEYHPGRSELSWNVHSSLSLALLTTWTQGESTFEAGAITGILSYINRPPYALEGDRIFDALFNVSKYFGLGRIHFLNRFNEIGLHAGYARNFGEHFTGLLRFSWNYFSFNEPAKVESADSRISLIMGYRI